MSVPSSLDEEIEAHDISINKNILEIAGKFINYALENFPKLIIDDATGNVIWPEAYARLGQIVAENPDKYKDMEDPTPYFIADVLEELLPTIPINKVDDTLRKLPFGQRFIISLGVATTKTALKSQPAKRDEISEMGEFLVLTMVQNEKTMRAYEILKDRPHMLNYITRYLFWRLDVKYVEGNGARLIEANMPDKAKKAQDTINALSKSPASFP